MIARIATGETTEPPFTSLDGALSIAVGAAHVHLPAKAPRHAKRLDFHENKHGTPAGIGQASCGALLMRSTITSFAPLKWALSSLLGRTLLTAPQRLPLECSGF
jgi:hypothetical protein